MMSNFMLYIHVFTRKLRYGTNSVPFFTVILPDFLCLRAPIPHFSFLTL
jgi:hypothetical protein